MQRTSLLLRHVGTRRALTRRKVGSSVPQGHSQERPLSAEAEGKASSDTAEAPLLPPELEEAQKLRNAVPPPEGQEMVELWNKEGINGPEWMGPRGGEPTRYGDWAQKGRCTDFE